MTRARQELIDPCTTPYYHCMVRCVRRAYLFGDDPLTGRNYDHRKQWTVVRLRQLATVFAIDICAYAVMSNHYHMVLHINEARAKSWDDREVAERWCSIFKGPLAIQKWLSGDILNESDRMIIDSTVLKWRQRLTSISWFMRCMNETIARQANREDGCKGRFWEGRFKSQALLDEAALLACMTYVDLNPVRAGITDKLEHSDFTSIQLRLFEYLSRQKHCKNKKSREKDVASIKRRFEEQEITLRDLLPDLPQADLPFAPLMPFDSGSHTPVEVFIPYTEQDYLQLVDETGRVVREGKKGFINESSPPILERFGVDPQSWITCVRTYGKMFATVVGSRNSMDAWRVKAKKVWLKGVGTALVAKI